MEGGIQALDELPDEMMAVLDGPLRFSKEYLKEICFYIGVGRELEARAAQMRGSRERLFPSELLELVEQDARFSSLYERHYGIFAAAVDGSWHDDVQCKRYLDAIVKGDGDPERTIVAIMEAHNEMGRDMARKMQELQQQQCVQMPAAV